MPNNSKIRSLSTSLLLLTLPRALTVCTDKRSAACLVSRRSVDCDEVARLLVKHKINFSPLSTGGRGNDGVFTPPAAIDCFHSLTSFSLALFIDIIATLCFFCCWAQQTLHCYLIHFFPVYTFLSLASDDVSFPHPIIRWQHNNLKRLFNSSMAHMQVVSSEHCSAAGNIWGQVQSLPYHGIVSIFKLFLHMYPLRS